MADNTVIDTFMKTVLDSYKQTALQQVNSENARGMSAMQGTTTDFKKEDVGEMSKKYGSMFPDPAVMEAAITQGNKLLSLTRQVDTIQKLSNVTEGEALKIREKMSNELLKYSQDKLDMLKESIKLIKDLTGKEDAGLIIEQERYKLIKDRAKTELSNLAIIDKQLIRAKEMVKAQLIVNVARGKTSFKDAAIGTLSNGGSIKDIASLGLQAAKLKMGTSIFGEKGLALMRQGSTMKSEGAAMIANGDIAGGGKRAAEGSSLQVAAVIIAAANGFAKIIVGAAKIAATAITEGINLLNKGFSGGIQGLMQGAVTLISGLTQGLLAIIPVWGAGLGTAAAKVITAAGELLINIRMWQLQNSQLMAQSRRQVIGRTGYNTGIDDRGLPPNLIMPWVNALAQQGVSNNRRRNKIMDLGMTMGMDAGESSQNYSAMRDTIGGGNVKDKVTASAIATERLSIAFKSAKDSAKETGLATTVFTNALNKAAVAARYMQVDFKQVVGLSNKLTEGGGAFAGFGLNIKNDLEGILESAASFGKDWSYATKAFAGQQIYGGMYKGNILGGMNASEFGKKGEESIQKGGLAELYRSSKGKTNEEYTSDLMTQKMWVATKTAMEVSKGLTGDKSVIAQRKAFSDIFGKDIPPYLIGAMTDAFEKSGGDQSKFAKGMAGSGKLEDMAKETTSAKDILWDTNRIEMMQFDIQRKMVEMLGRVFNLLSKSGTKKEKYDNFMKAQALIKEVASMPLKTALHGGKGVYYNAASEIAGDGISDDEIEAKKQAQFENDKKAGRSGKEESKKGTAPYWGTDKQYHPGTGDYINDPVPVKPSWFTSSTEWHDKDKQIATSSFQKGVKGLNNDINMNITLNIDNKAFAKISKKVTEQQLSNGVVV